MDRWERVADRGYVLGLAALVLGGGSWFAGRGQIKLEDVAANAAHVSQVVDQNSKAVNDYAGMVNSRLAALEQKAGIQPPAPLPPKK
jgi:hypothetical protein